MRFTGGSLRWLLPLLLILSTAFMASAQTAEKPRYVAVTARGVSVVPGAIVCPSHAAVSLMFDQYASHWEASMQDAMTHGQSTLVRGQPTPAPNLKAHGCVLLPPGTPMTLDTRNVVPVVTAKLRSGTTVKGVTLPSMIVPNQQQINAQVWAQDSSPSAAQQQMLEAKAKPLLEQLKSKPNDAVLLAEIGDLYYDAHVFPVAIDYYQKSLAINPNTAVRTDMATALFYSNDPDHAIAEFDRALKDNPKNSNALYNRGIVKFQARMDVKGALEDWETLLKQDPSYDQADKVRMYMAQAKPKPVPVENSTAPTQPPSIPEIDQQANALWKQKRYSEAIPLFNEACNGGRAGSCDHLGLMYDFGEGVKQDVPRASALYSKSCNAGNGAACYHLSMLQQYQPGSAVCNSGALASNLKRGCELGVATSCSTVGYSYIHGCGVAKDVEKGRELLSKGCALGDSNACDGIK